MIEHVTTSEQETISIGREFARQLRDGDIVLLSGPLGAGKTAFVRGLAEGLGADPDDVSSPTFAIIQEYRGRVPLQHVDLYRLSSVEVDDLALLELGANAVMAVEWPERWVNAPADVWRVNLDVVDEHRRRITTERR